MTEQETLTRLEAKVDRLEDPARAGCRVALEELRTLYALQGLLRQITQNGPPVAARRPQNRL